MQSTTARTGDVGQQIPPLMLGGTMQSSKPGPDPARAGNSPDNQSLSLSQRPSSKASGRESPISNATGPHTSNRSEGSGLVGNVPPTSGTAMGTEPDSPEAPSTPTLEAIENENILLRERIDRLKRLSVEEDDLDANSKRAEEQQVESLTRQVAGHRQEIEKLETENKGLKNLVAQLQKRIEREIERSKAIPKATNTVPTSLEANLHLRYQFNKKLELEREKYKLLHDQNSELISKIKKLEQEHSLSLTKQVANDDAKFGLKVNDALLWKNKVRDIEEEKRQLAYQLEQSMGQLEKENRERKKLLRELEDSRLQFQHLALGAPFDRFKGKPTAKKSLEAAAQNGWVSLENMSEHSLAAIENEPLKNYDGGNTQQPAGASSLSSLSLSQSRCSEPADTDAFGKLDAVAGMQDASVLLASRRPSEIPLLIGKSSSRVSLSKSTSTSHLPGPLPLSHSSSKILRLSGSTTSLIPVSLAHKNSLVQSQSQAGLESFQPASRPPVLPDQSLAATSKDQRASKPGSKGDEPAILMTKSTETDPDFRPDKPRSAGKTAARPSKRQRSFGQLPKDSPRQSKVSPSHQTRGSRTSLIQRRKASEGTVMRNGTQKPSNPPKHEDKSVSAAIAAAHPDVGPLVDSKLDLSVPEPCPKNSAEPGDDVAESIRNIEPDKSVEQGKPKIPKEQSDNRAIAQAKGAESTAASKNKSKINPRKPRPLQKDDANVSAQSIMDDTQIRAAKVQLEYDLWVAKKIKESAGTAEGASTVAASGTRASGEADQG
ncbi:uncharacterized protein BJ171DRAFT_511720 [Polychytrium aggregatum]|uniref:uncharacterized protein n=1 Tax=Polychytrium aggregatum TaxID=110093 RepID=UPI0022FE0B7D|nr:uncharacterized protein BJ171DRAFT_511720 [Polychytrium aggregatum]KAI9203075.1 hypothetical protein BJ171DRAFT_511720 [Polychytrium aggregatum]